MSDARSLAQTAWRAIQQQDIDRATQALDELQADEPSIVALLDDLEAAVSEGRRGEAATLLETLRRRYDEVLSAETTRVSRSLAARDRAKASTDQRRSLHDHGRQATSVQMSRPHVLLSTQQYVDGAEIGDSLTERISDLRALEQNLRDRRDEAERTLSSLSLPANLTVTAVGVAESPVPVGSDVSLDVELVNPGDAPASDVTVQADTRDELSLSSASEDVGTLSPDETRTVTFEGTAQAAGETTVSVTAAGDATSSGVKNLTLTITESGSDSVVEAIAGPDGQVSSSEVLQAISLYNNEESVPGTGGQVPTGRDILQIIALYNSDSSV